MARNMSSRFRFRRAKKQFARLALSSGVKRVLRSQSSFAMTTGAGVETRQTIFSAADAPTDIKTAEAGSKLTTLVIKMDNPGAAPGSSGAKMECLVYLNRSNLEITSSTLIADFWDTTEPPTKGSIDLRRATLGYKYKTIMTTVNQPVGFYFKIRFKRGLALYDGDRILVAVRSTTSDTSTWYYNAIAITRK